MPLILHAAQTASAMAKVACAEGGDDLPGNELWLKLNFVL